MKVVEIKDVGPAERPGSTGERSVAKTRPDRVNLEEAREAERIIASARLSTGVARAARLKELESAIRSGNYQPDASRLAEQLLSQAEVDARIRAILRG